MARYEIAAGYAVFLWLDSDGEQVPAHVRQVCENGANEVFLSVASVWEMQIKAQIGKLKLAAPLARSQYNKLK